MKNIGPSRPRLALAVMVLVVLSLGADHPSKSDRARLQAEAERHSLGIVLVGHPERGQGTGFVISRKHRLVATAAHVADLARGPGTIYAVINGTAVTYRVSRIWYHPSLMRTLDDGLVARSPDPNDGPVSVPGPDVAVLELESNGYELPEEWPLAGPGLAGHLEGRAIASMGYPGVGRWPTEQRPAAAAVFAGVVIHEDGFSPGEGGHPAYRQSIEHSAATIEGSSGSPVFGTDGKVLAVHNILRMSRIDDQFRAGMSVRIDCLWELLAFHGLTAKMPATDPAWDVLVPNSPAQDPRIGDYHKAQKLVNEAKWLIARLDHAGAVAKCNVAVGLAPAYAEAYLQRSRAYTGYCGTNWTTLTPEIRRQQVQYALSDARLSFRLSPEKDEGICLLLQNLLYLGNLDGDKDAFREVVSAADHFLKFPGQSEAERSFLTNCRGQARHYLRDYDGALRDYSEAIRLCPTEPTWYVNRAQFYDGLGRPDLAAADRQVAAGLKGVR